MATIDELKQKVASLPTDRKGKWELTCASITKARACAEERGDTRALARIQEMANAADRHVTALLEDPSVKLPCWDDLG